MSIGRTSQTLEFLKVPLFKNIYLDFFERDREQAGVRERQWERGRESLADSIPSTEPSEGLYLKILRS